MLPSLSSVARSIFDTPSIFTDDAQPFKKEISKLNVIAIACLGLVTLSLFIYAMREKSIVDKKIEVENNRTSLSLLIRVLVWPILAVLSFLFPISRDLGIKLLVCSFPLSSIIAGFVYHKKND